MKVFFVQMVGGKCEWRFFCAEWRRVQFCKYESVWEEKQAGWIPQWWSWNPRWWNSRWLHYHQVRWEWMILSQNELVRVRVGVEVECFGVILREDNKVSESKMVQCLNLRWQNSRCLPSSSVSKWISLSQSQSGGRVFIEWIWEKITRCLNPRWWCLNPTGRIQDGCHHQVKWKWMSLRQIELVWVRV